MILRLAFRELWHTKLPLLLQIVSMAIALSAIAATNQIRQQTIASPVMGANCATDVFAITGRLENKRIIDQWTPRQANALIAALSDNNAATIYYGSAQVRSNRVNQTLLAGYVSKDYFQMLCVPRRNTVGSMQPYPFINAAVIDEPTYVNLRRPKEITAKFTTAIESFTEGFSGTENRLHPVQVWLPYSQLRTDMGQAFDEIDLEIVQVIAKPMQGQSEDALLKKVGAELKKQRGLFPGIESLQAGNNVQMDGQTLELFRSVVKLMALFAGALLFMVVVNLFIYHLSRTMSSKATAYTLMALGMPPKSMFIYALIEPMLVATSSIAVGLMISIPLAKAAVSAVSDQDLPNSALPAGSIYLVLIAMTIITVIATTMRWREFTTVSHQAQGRANRTLIALLPTLIVIQVAMAVATISVGAQSALALYRAIPNPPNINLDGLSVIAMMQPHEAKAQDNLQLRWKSAWIKFGISDYQAALAESNAPFLPAGGWMGTIGYGDKSVACLFNSVTGNVFDVLGVQVPGADHFVTEANIMGLTTDQVIVSSILAEQLFGSTKPISGLIVRSNRTPNKMVTAKDKASIVRGVFDSGIVGANGAVGKVGLIVAQQSQAALPVTYLPMKEVRAGEGFYVFVRHPIGVKPQQAALTVLPAIQSIFPAATVADADSALNYYRYPLIKNRAMALVLGVLATASLSIGIFGLLSLLKILMQRLKTEMAVRFAVGATRAQSFALVLKKIMPVILIGLMLAALPTAALITILNGTIILSALAGNWGPIVGVVAVIMACTLVIIRSAQEILRANFMNWLRYE